MDEATMDQLDQNSTLAQMHTLVHGVLGDYQKAVKGNVSAKRRVRKQMQVLRKLAVQLREEQKVPAKKPKDSKAENVS